MAIHRRRVCRWDLDGNLHRRHLPFDLNAKIGTDGKSAHGKGVDRQDGGYAAMDMSVSSGSFFSRLFSGRGLTAVSNYFVMDWASVWVDIVLDCSLPEH